MNIVNRWLEAMTPPSSQKFFTQLKGQADVAVAVAVLLEAAVRDGRLGTADFTARLHVEERKADELMDRIMYAVRQTMIHPVDPDDLRHIAYSIDSAVDTMDHFAWRMEAYRLPATPAMARIIGEIREMTVEMGQLFARLLANDPVAVQELYRSLRRREEEVDRMYHAAVTELHAGGENSFTVSDEVLAILERCADQCMHVGRAVVVMLERNT